MADPQEPTLTVRFERLERDTKLVKEYDIDSSYLTSTDGWSVTIYDPDRDKLRDLDLEPVELLIDGASQVLGRVDVTDVGGDGSAVTLQGRDYIADLVECNVDPALKIKEQMTLADALSVAFGPVGISTIFNEGDLLLRNIRSGKTVKGGGGAGKDFKALKLEEIKPEPGTGLYEWGNRLVARHGATIQPAVSRDSITLSEPNYKQDPLYKIVRTSENPNSAANTVISARAMRDFSSFPTVALFTGKHGRDGVARGNMQRQYDFQTLSQAFNAELARVTNRVFGGAGDSARRKPPIGSPLSNAALYRLLYHRDEDAKNPDQLERAAKRAIAERLKETLRYTATLRGHADPTTGALWSVDTMVQVVDEICNINEPLWIEQRTFRYSPSAGATTTITAWRPDSFQIG